ncbi:uncharacterized protein LOC108158884 [Drosophila miranda]|uniref:uncharacterized protein LOC108158884 n=1 Tax=Drosophila miranda TaxID=7229 RepID=UPI00143F6359|nr:uncharacterized protein LOC108158884 [Drosophila miranda]
MAKNLEDTLNDLNGELINFDKDRKTFTAHYTELRNQLYSLWKRDEKLGKLLKGSTLGGSYGDNLKVSKPDEFDLLIHLEFPENNRIIVKPDPRRPGNVTLDMTKVMEAIRDSEHHRPIYEQLQKLVNGKNMLLEDRLQNWLQGLMIQALNKIGNQIEVNKTISKLTYKKCGPAHTIFVTGPYKYSVDFVPGIKLVAAQSVLAGDQKKHFGNSTHWYAIAKPLKPPQPDNNSFRASYYAAEHELLKDKANLKNAVRLLKKFRDAKQNLSNLKSYYIKTVFLWEVTKRDPRYWQSPLHEIFIEMMSKLANALKLTPGKGKLQFFWDPKLEMIADLSSNQRAEMFNCVVKSLYRFHRPPQGFTDDKEQHAQLLQ